MWIKYSLLAVALSAALAAPARAATPDAWITTKTKLALLTTKGVSGTAIKVDTVAGRVTLNEAIRTLQQAEKTVLVARQAGRGELGHIEIGYVGSAIFTGVLSKAISRFREANPLVEFRLNEIGIVQQLDDVSSSRLDLGILRLPVKSLPPDLAIVSLHREPIILAIPRGHRLARQKSVTLEALKSEPFVAVQIQEGSGFNAQVAQIRAKGGLSPQITQRAGQFTALAGLVAGGLGVAFVPETSGAIGTTSARTWPSRVQGASK
jgi:DNA-binding transcriptional LysR family regulator